MQEGGTLGLKMCGFPTPTKAEQPGKLEALWLDTHTQRTHRTHKAMSHDTSAPSVNGQTLEGITGEANLSSMEQPESTTVLSVTTTSSHSINDHIQGTPVTFLVDTGSIITIVPGAYPYALVCCRVASALPA